METKSYRGLVALCLGIALLAGATSAAGVFLRGDGATTGVESVRGERFEMTTNGVYAYNSQRMVAEGVGWDWFTLLIAVPALLASLPLLARGSLRGRLFALGLLAYFFYQYMMYAMSWAFGPLFLPFVVIYAASLVAIGWIVSTIDLAALPGQFSDRFPRRGMAILSLLMSGVLVLMWMQRIVVGLRGDLNGAMLLGQSTMVVQAMDLGMIVPLAVFTAVMALKARPLGYLLCSVFVVKSMAMASAICAMLISAWVVEGKPEVVPMMIFGGAAAAATWLGARMYRSAIPDHAAGAKVSPTTAA